MPVFRHTGRMRNEAFEHIAGGADQTLLEKDPAHMAAGSVEGIFLLLIPLVIGWAVDDLNGGETRGLWQLFAVCLMLLIVGACRRFHDTRVYSGIYREVSNELVLREKARKTDLSRISARTHLFTEFIEFLENSLPDIFNQFVGLVGALVNIALIDLRVLSACLLGALMTLGIFMLSQNRMLRLNRGQNNELEKQVDIIAAHDPDGLGKHFRALMGWNIKLSDLETINFSLTWIVLAGVLLYSIVAVASSDTAGFGRLVSTVMYVFGFIDSVMTFPLYYQQMIRLGEIADRLG